MIVALCCLVDYLQKYEDWKDGLPDFKWLEDTLPKGDKISEFSKSLLEFGHSVKDVIEIGKYSSN